MPYLAPPAWHRPHERREAPVTNRRAHRHLSGHGRLSRARTPTPRAAQSPVRSADVITHRAVTRQRHRQR
eukprot:6335105-Prymnesium_polylepis.1